jgi:hypothetical protein
MITTKYHKNIFVYFSRFAELARELDFSSTSEILSRSFSDGYFELFAKFLLKHLDEAIENQTSWVKCVLNLIKVRGNDTLTTLPIWTLLIEFCNARVT